MRKIVEQSEPDDEIHKILTEIQEPIFELYKEWCRLKGYKMPTSPIEMMVDEATGAERDRMEQFSEFVRDHVFASLPESTPINTKE